MTRKRQEGEDKNGVLEAEEQADSSERTRSLKGIQRSHQTNEVEFKNPGASRRLGPSRRVNHHRHRAPLLRILLLSPVQNPYHPPVPTGTAAQRQRSRRGQEDQRHLHQHQQQWGRSQQRWAMLLLQNEQVRIWQSGPGSGNCRPSLRPTAGWWLRPRRRRRKRRQQLLPLPMPRPPSLQEYVAVVRQPPAAEFLHHRRPPHNMRANVGAGNFNKRFSAG
ncbi:uncharacterized protein LOC144763284 isoform X1 [Lissotriton helveticus]